MKFSEKKQAYNRLQGAENLDSDRMLLQRHAPNAGILAAGILNKEKAQREILWELLDHASVEDIQANRTSGRKDSNAFKEILSILSLGMPKTKDEILSVDKKLGNLIDKIGEKNVPDEIKETIASFKGFIQANLQKIEADEAAAMKVFAEKELQMINLKEANQKTLARLAKDLTLETPDYKAATLRTLLEEYRLNIPKEGAGTGHHNTEVPADTRKVNELESENEDLKDKVDELESENEDLEDKIENEKKS